ncbi:hypothetical protein ACJMK2_014406 [Sinanodonta woodiana]|uniref:Uncharacterized protein n=1 Tax=Sinanodonta woodiana TaxID=1069815 RepID=A0ABD3V0L0_SINWO
MLNTGRGEINIDSKADSEVNRDVATSKIDKVKSDKNIIKITSLTEKNKTLRRQLNESFNINSTFTDTINQLQHQNSTIQQQLLDLREQLKDVTQSRDQLRKSLNELREKLTSEQKGHTALKIQYDKLSNDYQSLLAQGNNNVKQHRKKKNDFTFSKEAVKEIQDSWRVNELFNSNERYNQLMGDVHKKVFG